MRGGRSLSFRSWCEYPARSNQHDRDSRCATPADFFEGTHGVLELDAIAALWDSAISLRIAIHWHYIRFVMVIQRLLLSGLGDRFDQLVRHK